MITLLFDHDYIILNYSIQYIDSADSGTKFKSLKDYYFPIYYKITKNYTSSNSRGFLAFFGNVLLLGKSKNNLFNPTTSQNLVLKVFEPKIYHLLLYSEKFT